MTQLAQNQSFFKNFSKTFKTTDGKDYTKIFILVSTLFLLWGFSMGLIDVLNKHFQEYLHLSKAKSGFIQFAYYIGYFIMAIPAGLFAKKFGYKGGIVAGLFLVALGSLWAIPATKIGTFSVFLIGLFIIATGLSSLETVANPYTTLLGPVNLGAARINLAQSCNAIGQMLGPLIGGQIILSEKVGETTGNATLYIPYAGIALIVIVLAAIFLLVRLPENFPQTETIIAENITAPTNKPLWKKWHFNFAVVSQLFYLVAQTGIFSFFINYTVSNLRNCSDRTASVYLSLGGLGMFLAGRIIGSFILRKAKPDKALAVYALANIILMLIVMLAAGRLGVIALIASFFFMSIMFPTTFALGIYELGDQTKQASSFLVMTLVGGAFTPVMGYIADVTNISFGFIVPLSCFVIIFLYGIFWKKIVYRDRESVSI